MCDWIYKLKRKMFPGYYKMKWEVSELKSKLTTMTERLRHVENASEDMQAEICLKVYKMMMQSARGDDA